MDYDDLLNRGKDELPEKVESHGRFTVPAAKVTPLGKKTIVTNFGDICDMLNRDQDTVAKFVLRELGTAGSRAEGRITLSGSFQAQDVNSAIAKYVESFVMCKVCHLPDTQFLKEGKQAFIRCEACGAKYQVKG
jgi:translation initiation factor 2 subunit 2